MILEYTKETSVYEVGAYINVVDGETIVKDLMITYYTPTNFEGTTKNYLLGKDHPNWDRMHQEAIEKFYKEWLVELGYDPTKYHVANDTKAIVRHQTVGTLTTFELPITESEKI